MGQSTMRFLISTLPMFHGVNKASYLESIIIHRSFSFIFIRKSLPIDYIMSVNKEKRNGSSKRKQMHLHFV